VALDTGKIAGAEALVRWKKNDGTLLPPMDFIPLLEKTDEITHLDFYVYESVCRYLHERLNKKLVTVPISVNVSRRHLKNHLFIEQIKSLTSQYEIPPALLEFELTETLFLENSDEAILLQKNLHQAGFTLSLDDFGSGFSSLNLLKKMTLDVIKIDRSFLEGNVINSVDKTIIRCIIHMAKLLNITVLCEGAETLEQVQYLRKARCSMVQGFYFSKPLSIEKMNDLLDSGKIYSIPYALKNPVPH
jgi:EAL domain-containing protein (putative c-di-GMP-specific phosphodiesterase class I)